MENQQDDDTEKKLPVLTRKAFLDFVLKYEATANECVDQCFGLVNECISEPSSFMQYAIKLLHHLIKQNRDVIGTKTEADSKVTADQQVQLRQQGFSTIQKIKHYLIKIRNLKDLDEDDVLI
jgi:hypothetical protein